METLRDICLKNCKITNEGLKHLNWMQLENINIIGASIVGKLSSTSVSECPIFHCLIFVNFSSRRFIVYTIRSCIQNAELVHMKEVNQKGLVTKTFFN